MYKEIPGYCYKTRTVRDRMKIIIVTSINGKKINSKDDVHHSYQIGLL